MTERDDPARPSDYLWDPRAPRDADVADLEARLESVRFDPAARPLAYLGPVRAIARRVPWRVGLALAATLAVIAGTAGFLMWRLTWPEGRSWVITSSSTPAPRLEVDRPLQVSEAPGVRIAVARVGSMDARPGTELTLTQTRSSRHRLVMSRGTVNVRLWAPPGTVALYTPEGSVIDLGCVFQLVVDAAGTRVRVDTGWVQLENFFGETLAPAGTSAFMTRDRRPVVPVYDDARSVFRDAVRAFEHADTDEARLAIGARLLPEARRRDVLTLLMLANATAGPARRVLLDRGAMLVPPPAGVTVQGILDGDSQSLWTWYGALDLPAPKSWWRDWPDVFPWPWSRQPKG